MTPEKSAEISRRILSSYAKVYGTLYAQDVLRVAVIHAIVDAYRRGFEKCRERAVSICTENDEVVRLKDDKRFLEPKSSNNVNGNTYAEAISALQPTEE